MKYYRAGVYASHLKKSPKSCERYRLGKLRAELDKEPGQIMDLSPASTDGNPSRKSCSRPCWRVNRARRHQDLFREPTNLDVNITKAMAERNSQIMMRKSAHLTELWLARLMRYWKWQRQTYRLQRQHWNFMRTRRLYSISVNAPTSHLDYASILFRGQADRSVFTRTRIFWQTPQWKNIYSSCLLVRASWIFIYLHQRSWHL